MMFKNILMPILTAGLMALPAAAQNTAKPSVCVTDANFRAFDFWLGEWAVSDRVSGKHAGHNSITAIEGGCVLKETWAGTGGSTGQSMNYYNPNTGKWRQLWLSGGAYAIDIEGGLDARGAMALTGTIWYYGNGQTADFRGTWTPNADGSVRQFFEQYDAEKKEWQPWFDGLYVKASKQD